MATEKLAFVCDSSTAISAHFGRAPLVVVVTLEDGREVAREERVKERPGAIHLYEHRDEHSHEHDHAHHRHDHGAKFRALADCNVLIVRGAGGPVVEHAEQLGMRVFLVGEKTVDEALAAYQSGMLRSDPRRIHRH